jgi:aspartate/methionine/tyrosine aminotransferase
VLTARFPKHVDKKRIIPMKAISNELSMSSAQPPFNQLYESFGFFSKVGRTWKSDFLPMSAGANWIQASPALVTMLQRELSAATTYRNYGRALGLRPVTDILEMVETALSGKRRSGLAVTITNGATEGACLCMEALTHEENLRAGDQALLIGHAYPLYELLAQKFSLRCVQLLGDDSCETSFLPTIERVLETLDSTQPRLVFLLVPNNPLGETYREEELSRVVDWCSRHDAFLLVDRVCQLPWDDRRSLMAAMEPGIVGGRVFITDSFSKSESFAGLRTGFVVTARSWQTTLERLTQHRYLNPVAFSTVTLAMSRLAEVGPNISASARRLISAYAPALYCEYPKDEARLAVDELLPAFIAQYAAETECRKRTVRANFDTLQHAFGKDSCRRLILTSGFNVSLELPQMLWRRELDDQSALGKQHGVGVLTERCFRSSRRSRGRYFIRLGLSLTERDFAAGLGRLRTYYFQAKSS